MPLFTAIGTALGASATVAAGATMSAAFATGLGATALAGGAVGYSMYSSDQQMKAAKAANSGQVQMPATPAAPKAVDAAKIAQQQATNRSRAMARSESIKTNPLGLKDEADVVRKTLLGS